MCNFHCLYLSLKNLKNSDNPPCPVRWFEPQDYTESVEAIGRALKELKAKSKVQRAWWKELAISGTLPKFNSSPLKNDGWKTILSFWGPVHFQGLCLTSGVYFSVLSKNASDHWSFFTPEALYKWTVSLGWIKSPFGCHSLVSLGTNILQFGYWP